MAHVMVQLDRIIKAVKSTMPQQMWGEIVRKLDQTGQHPESLGEEPEALDESGDGYDLIEFAEEDDEV